MLLDNIYVINMDKSIDRLNMIKDNFNEYNLKFTRFPAVDGKKIKKSILNKNTTLLCKTILCNKGIIGCSLSHINIWKQLVNDKSTNYYVVLEDDSVVDNLTIETLEEIDTIKDKIDFDMISLFCGPEGNILCNQYDKIYELSNGIIIGKPFLALTTTGYIISKKGAKKLISYINKINYHVDTEIAINTLFRNINYYSLNMNVVKPNWKINSTIEKSNSKSILINLLSSMKLYKLVTILNVNVITINMKYSIPLYSLLLVLLLLINIFIIDSIFLNVIIIVELILSII